MRPDQAEKMQKLEQRYGQSLDENTRLYSKYYKDCIKSDSATSKKALPMVPIAEPPTTPLHEMSRSIPDYVKFGPILPKSVGFSPFLKDIEDEGENDRLNTTSSPNVKHRELAGWSPKAKSITEDEDDCGPERGDADTESEAKTLTNSMRNNNIGGSVSKVQQLRKKGHTRSPMLFSPINSPKTPSPKSPSLKQSGSSKKDVEPIVGFLSNRLTDPTTSASLPLSPQLYSDSSLSPESDSEVKPKSVRKNLSSRRSLSFDSVNTQILTNSLVNEYEVDGSHSTSVASSGKTTPLNRPPKDFMCPIIGQLFIDPVTLETSQPYERRAIQEWLKKGNTTCPITRQPLSATLLPKTNYVLKRLITYWKEQCPDLAQEYSCVETPRSSFNTTSSR